MNNLTEYINNKDLITDTILENDAFSKHCGMAIFEELNTIIHSENPGSLKDALPHLVQLDLFEIVLKWNELLEATQFGHNQDYIFRELAYRYRAINKLAKLESVMNKFHDPDIKLKLIEEMEKNKGYIVPNSLFGPPKTYELSEELNEFFKSNPDRKTIEDYIYQQIKEQEKTTKSKDSRLWNLAYSFERIIRNLTDQEKFEEALIFLEHTPSKKPRWGAQHALALKLSIHDLQRALQIVKGIKDSDVKAGAIMRIALKIYNNGNIEESMKLIRTLSLAQKDRRNKFICFLVERLVKDGYSNDALKLMDAFLLPHDGFFYDSLLLIAVDEMIKGKYENVLNYVDYFETPTWKIKYLCGLICFNNHISRLKFNFQNNYFLPDRFKNHEIEFWNLYDLKSN